MKKIFLALALTVAAACAVTTLRADDTSTNSAPATTNTLATVTFRSLDTNAVTFHSLDTNAVAMALDTNATLTAKN